MQIVVIGLGYVGLPVAVGLGEKFPGLIGFDINVARVSALREGRDATNEMPASRLKSSAVRFTCDPTDIAGADVYIVCVPTPVDEARRPDLTPLQKASETVGRAITKGAIVAFESTVYPGATEEVCGPIIEKVSGLRQGVDFKLGYSPERINPGDKEHTFETIVKVVAGEDEATAETLSKVYGAAVTAGIHRAPSIKVAEMAKVLENTQRDLNIALMNEVALICDRMAIRTHDVLQTAGTKWNFLRFSPGLVGGHCIGVDPYYLTTKAETLKYYPEVILAGRRINDSMGGYIARRAIRYLAHGDAPMHRVTVGILGVTFKENVPDIRNSRVPDIFEELLQFGVTVRMHDPIADATELKHEYDITLDDESRFVGLDAVILAVPHRAYAPAEQRVAAMLRPGGVILDVRSALDPKQIPAGLSYWSL